MTSRSLVVVSAGVRQPSSTRLLADRLADRAVAALRARGVDADSDIIEARDHANDLTHNLLTGFPSPRLAEAIGRVRVADGLIAVTPIFNGSYSGLFKVLFDVLDLDSLRGTPVLLAATGGTARHSLALEHAVRPLFSYLGAATVPTAVFAAPEDWGTAEAPAGGLAERIERAAGELAAAMLPVRAPRPGVEDRYDDPTPFQELLRRA